MTGRRIWPLLAVLAIASLARAESNLRQSLPGSGVTFDPKSFLVNGERVLFLSGGVHYFRIPPEEWRDRLLQTRLAGFNMVETPVPWNLHEPLKGQYRFEGGADLGRFLELCHELKLWVFLRIGPCVNAAVSGGGLPAWLGEDPQLLVRSSNDRFLDAVRRYWAKLLPLIAKYQLPRGPVALVQIEDHYKGQDEAYLPRLHKEAQDRGIQVPVVLSELNPCKDFQRLGALDSALYFTTEVMPGMPLSWGEQRKPLKGFGDLILEGIAKGIDGYNHPLWAAGTNLLLPQSSGFPTRHEAATTGLLEGGGATPVFAEIKKVNLFARALQKPLSQATSLQQHPILDQARQAGLMAYGRTDGTTSILFLRRRYGEGLVPLTDPATGESASFPTSVADLRHIILNHPLTPKTALALSTAQVLACVELAGRRVLVVYVPLNAEALVVVRTPQKPTIRLGENDLAWNERSKQLVLRWKCGEKAARKDFLFEADVPIHIIALEESQAGLTWLLDGAGILIGVPRVGEWTTGAQTTIDFHIPCSLVNYAVTFYPGGPQRGVGKLPGLAEPRYDDKAKRIDFRVQLEPMEPIPAYVRKWEMAEASAEAAPSLDDASWREAPRPEPAGEERYAWYRCRFRAPRAGTEKLIFENIADAAFVYLNGQYVGQSATKRLMDAPRSFALPANFDAPVKAGENVLAILLKNWGCYQNTSSYGMPLTAASGWGILGNVTLDGRDVGRWRRREGISPASRSLTWGPPKDTPSPLRWYRTTFPLRPHKDIGSPFSQEKTPDVLGAARLHLNGPSHGSLWVNGHFAGLYHQTGAEIGQGYYIPSAWLSQQNEIILLEEGGKPPADAELAYDRSGTYLPLKVPPVGGE